MSSRSSHDDARAALQESEDRYRLLVENIPVQVWTASPEGQLDFVSEQTARLLGEPLERLLDEGWRCVVHPDDWSEAALRWSHAVEHVREYQSELRLRMADGTYAWHLSRARPQRRADGSVVRWLGTNTNVDEQHKLREDRDVNQRVEARARDAAQAHDTSMQAALLRLVTDAVPVLISFVTADERYGYINHHYHEWFGLGPEELIGRTLRDVLGEPAYEKMAPLVKRALAGERFGLERRGVPYQHGGTRDVKAEFVPQRNAEGEVIGYAALVEDITDRLVAQRALDAMTEERTLALESVSQALRMQSDFEQKLIGIVSHDLRTPLNSIVMSMALLAQDESLSAQSARVVLRARSAADRATRMIRDLLDFTQARLGGGIHIERRPADMRELVEQVLSELETLHAGRQVELTVEGDTRGAWDHDRMAQVVQNLLGNALKYSDPASKVSVRVKADAELVTLHFHNEGIIAADKLPKIFEPFQRATTSPDRKSRSVGLGLYIVHHIVAGHGGTIAVESNEAHGTTFSVRLSRARA